jgi:hypothetical protein
MIAAYHGKMDCSAAEILAVNPFVPPAQTAARLWGYDHSRPGRAKDAAMPFRAMPYMLRSQRMKSR